MPTKINWRKKSFLWLTVWGHNSALWPCLSVWGYSPPLWLCLTVWEYSPPLWLCLIVYGYSPTLWPCLTVWVYRPPLWPCLTVYGYIPHCGHTSLFRGTIHDCGHAYSELVHVQCHFYVDGKTTTQIEIWFLFNMCRLVYMHWFYFSNVSMVCIVIYIALRLLVFFFFWPVHVFWIPLCKMLFGPEG